MSEHWSQGLIGLPYLERGRTREGCDCWGLVMLAQAARGFTIPGYDSDYVTPDERAGIDAVIAREKDNPNWRRVDRHAEGDVAIFRVGRFDSHAGICVRRNLMLHMPAKGTSHIEDFRSGVWAPRLVGFWRWNGGAA